MNADEIETSARVPRRTANGKPEESAVLLTTRTRSSAAALNSYLGETPALDHRGKIFSVTSAKPSLPQGISPQPLDYASGYNNNMFNHNPRNDNNNDSSNSNQIENEEDDEKMFAAFLNSFQNIEDSEFDALHKESDHPEAGSDYQNIFDELNPLPMTSVKASVSIDSTSKFSVQKSIDNPASTSASIPLQQSHSEKTTTEAAAITVGRKISSSSIETLNNLSRKPVREKKRKRAALELPKPEDSLFSFCRPCGLEDADNSTDDANDDKNGTEGLFGDAPLSAARAGSARSSHTAEGEGGQPHKKGDFLSNLSSFDFDPIIFEQLLKYITAQAQSGEINPLLEELMNDDDITQDYLGIDTGQCLEIPSAEKVSENEDTKPSHDAQI